MAYQPGIFQYGTIGADGGFGIGYDDYGDTNTIYTLPPFKVNENTGNDGTGLNNTFNDPTIGSLYDAGLTGGNIFTGGTGASGGGGGKVQTPTDDGGYKNPVNIADYKAGLIGPAGYPSGRSELQPINPPGPVVLPKVEVPIGQQGEVGAGGYTDAVNQSLFTQGLIGPAGYSSGTAPSVGPINPQGQVVLPKVEVPGTKINNELDAAAQLSLLNSIGSGVNTAYVPLASAGVFPGPASPSGPSQLPKVEVPIGTRPASQTSTEVLDMMNLMGQRVYDATVVNPGTPITLPAQTTNVNTTNAPQTTAQALNMMGSLGQRAYDASVVNSGNPVTLQSVTAVGGYTDPDKIALYNEGLIGPSSNPRDRSLNPNVTILPAVTAKTNPDVTPGVTPGVIPAVAIGTTLGTIPSSTTASTTASTTSSGTGVTPFDPNSINSGVGTYGTNAQTLTTKRNFGAELAETLKALQDNQAGIMGMYGDLYKQFMPKGITDTESSIIDQYKTDLARLQQRQAGVLAPEDIRQSQQAAREAYGARGQVMGRGAVGAEIMGRENIRQQREDQARAGMQASYGNIMNMANLQTGNIFSPIGNLMSNTFNPLSPYAADVYGTNVNAQLAKEIAQKNYDAAVRSAELSGAAQRSAATTSAAGNILGPAIGGVIGKGLGAIFSFGASLATSCMPGDQCIDTPTGPKAIKDLKGGDSVIGYDGEVAFIAQACSWNQNPLRTFLTITREDGSSFTVCDDHKIMGIPAMEWVEGAELAGSLIKSIEESTGLLTSYDILTNQGGYRINGIPVNSMIPEIVMQVVEFHRQVDRNLQAIST
jgi:hypothetical protein